MRPLRAWLMRAAGLVGRTARDRDLAAEIDSHLHLHIDDNLRAGMTPVEARRAALLAFGGVAGVTETYRDRRGLPVVETLARDVRDAVRLLRRSPGFTTIAILSLALGIGANAAIFSLVNSLLLRALPVHEPGRLVQVHRDTDRSTWSNPLWEQIRARPDLFDGAFASSSVRFNLVEHGETDYADGLIVSGGFFDVLGVQPELGRLFTPADDRRGVPDGPIAIISHGFWQRRFGGAVDVLGRPLRLEHTTFTIVGVTPASFFGPEVGRAFEVIIPIGAEPLLRPRSMLDARSGWWLTIMARLKPGQTPEAATAALRAVQPQLRDATVPPNYRLDDQKAYLTKPMGVRTASAGTSPLRRAYRDPLVVIMIVVALVLLIACANIANLLLARGASRRHELSVRLALGASRWQLVRQMLVESLMLSLTGAAAGLLFAVWGSRLLVRQFSTPANMVFLDLSLDWRVLGFTAGIAVITALLFGTVPALRATRVEANAALKEQGRAITGERRWSLGSTLIVAQVALSLVLIVGAGLFLRTFTSLTHLKLGFDRDPILAVSLREAPGPATAEDPAARYRRLVDLVQSAPGVASAALTEIVPVTGSQWDLVIENPDGLSLPEPERDVYLNGVTPGWFATMGTRVVAGRDVDWRDTKDTPPVLLVNQAFAAKFFPGRSPLGHTIRETAPPGETPPAMTIVGIVEDAIYTSPREGVPPTMYKPLLQGDGSLDNLIVRAAGHGGGDIRPGVAAALAAFDKSISITFRPLAAQLDASLTSERIVAVLSGFFGGLALLLAGLGLYGVVSYAVSRRRTEIGIRMALGASTAGVVRLVVLRVALLVGAGAVAGGAISFWTSPLVATLLYGLEPRDPVTLIGAIVILAAVAAAASWWPARRASRINPTEVLRQA